VNMEGIGDELAAQLQKVGFQVRSLSNLNVKCSRAINPGMVRVNVHIKDHLPTLKITCRPFTRCVTWFEL
jgi:hypothetical protein